MKENTTRLKLIHTCTDLDLSSFLNLIEIFPQAGSNINVLGQKS